jgi:hypothetical protein
VIASVTAASAQTWGVGGRLGSGVEAVGQYVFANENYVEGRLGLGLLGGFGANFSATYNWHVADMAWTSEGNWFFDAGAGLYLGGGAYYARLGVMGVAKLGYTFETVPLSLALDWSPSFGPWVSYGTVNQVLGVVGAKTSGFDHFQLFNFGLSCVYRF